MTEFPPELSFRRDLLHSHRRIDYSTQLNNKSSNVIAGKGRNFTCEICNYKFIYPSHLKRHMRSHLGLKPFNCHLCKFGTTRSDAIHSHFVRKHPDHDCCICNACKRAFVPPTSAEMRMTTVKSSQKIHKNSGSNCGISRVPAVDDPNAIKKTDGKESAAKAWSLHNVTPRSSSQNVNDDGNIGSPTKLRAKKRKRVSEDVNFRSQPVSINSGKGNQCNFCNYVGSSAMDLLNHLRHHTGKTGR